MGKPRIKFRQAIGQSLRVEAVYWAGLCALVLASSLVRSHWFDILITAAVAHLGVGGWVVFALLHAPSRQDPSRFDVRGALANLYQCAWWPWYAARWWTTRRAAKRRGTR